MTGLLYYDADAIFKEDTRCNICGNLLGKDDGAWTYEENGLIKLLFCSLDCTEKFSKLNNMEEE